MLKETRVVGIGSWQGLNVEGQRGVLLTGGTENPYEIYKVLFDTRFSDRLHSKWKRCWNMPRRNLQTEEEYDSICNVDMDVFDSLIG